MSEDHSGVTDEPADETRQQPRRFQLAPSFAPGDLIGDYRVDAVKRGGQGIVYIVHRDGWWEALKTVRPDSENVPLAQLDLIREAQIGLLIPPTSFCVTTHRLARINGNFYAIQPAVRNKNLPTNLRDLIQTKYLSTEFAGFAGLAVILALIHASRHGIQAHLDIKPSNILVEELDSTPGFPQMRLADWGSAVVSPSLHTGPTTSASPFYDLHDIDVSTPVRWTPGYAAPELLRDKWTDPSEVDLVAADVFAIGATLLEIATELPVFIRHPSARIVRSTLARKVAFARPSKRNLRSAAEILASMTDPKPANRPSDLVDLAHQFQVSFFGAQFMDVEDALNHESFEESPDDKGLRALGLHKAGRDGWASALLDELHGHRKWVMLQDDESLGFTLLVGAEARQATQAAAGDDLEKRQRSLMMAGQFGEARAELQAAVLHESHEGDQGAILSRIHEELDRAEGHWLAGRGRVLTELSRWDAALTVLERAYELISDNFEVLYHLGTSQLQCGDSESAVKTLELALAVDPERPEAWNNLAAALITEGELPKAVDCMNRASQLDPTYARPFVSYAALLLVAKRPPPEVREVLLHALKNQPENQMARYMIQNMRLMPRPDREAR